MSKTRTGLYFRHRIVVTVTDIGDRQSQLSFVVALPEKFVTDFQTPFATHVPWPARVRYVSAFQCYLQYEVP